MTSFFTFTIAQNIQELKFWNVLSDDAGLNNIKNNIIHKQQASNLTLIMLKNSRIKPNATNLI